MKHGGKKHAFSWLCPLKVAPCVCVPQGMKVAVIEGHDIGGTCVNRGCVPSKALLAASGRIREMKNAAHMKSMGIQVSTASTLTHSRSH